MEYTAIFDSGKTEVVNSNSKNEVYSMYESSDDYVLDVVEGAKKIPPAAIEAYKKDPMAAIMASTNFNNEANPKTPLGPLVDETAKSNYGDAVVKEPRQFDPNPPKVEETKYYSANGVDFKLENGILYYKKYIKLDKPHHIKSIKTNAVTDKYYVEVEDWVQAEQS